MNPYQVLDVPSNATENEAKMAYRKLAQKFHPDRNKSQGAEQSFKQVQAAWEAIQAGWRAPAPAPVQTATRASDFHNAGYVQRCTIRVSFKDTFVGTLFQVPGTPFVVKPPYGVTPGLTVRQKVMTLDQQHQDIFEITWEVYDPNGFYKVEMLNGKPKLTCRLIVSAGQMLSGQEVTLPNINPQASSFNVKLQAASPIMVPMAGLATASGRDKLYLYLDTVYKDLEDERYDVLHDLKAAVEKALKAKADSTFS